MGRTSPAQAESLRVKSVHQLPVLVLVPQEAQLEGDHALHKSGEDRLLVRSDDLAVDLRYEKVNVVGH